MKSVLRSALVFALLWPHAPVSAAVSLTRTSLGKPTGAPTVLTLSAPSFQSSTLVLPQTGLATPLLTPLLQAPAVLPVQTVAPQSAPADVPTARQNLSATTELLTDLPVTTQPSESGHRLIDTLTGAQSIKTMDLPGAVVAPATSGTGPAPLARPTGPAKFVHLLAQPVKVSVSLGPVATVLHYTLETAAQVVNAAIVYLAGGGLWGAIPVLAIGLVKLPPMITAQSLLHLQAKYWWKLLGRMREIAQIPGVDRVRVVTTSETAFSGVLAKSKKNRGLVVLESALPQLELPPTLGTAIRIDDLGMRRLRLTLSVAGHDEFVRWEPTLQELMDSAPIPKGVAEAWRAAIRSSREELGWWRSFPAKDFRINATLLDETGATDLGALVQGDSILHLLRMARTDRLSKAIRRTLGRPTEGRPERSIPLSSAEVKEAGDDLGAWSLPRRLLGRLLIRR